MNTVAGIEIDFPVIDGRSSKQIWYAEHLRELYVSENFERFEEISKWSCLEIDSHMRDAHGDYLDEYKDYTFGMKLSKLELLILCSSNAGGIIANLIEWREDMEEEEEEDGFYAYGEFPEPDISW